jgi:hypothetical protein
MHFDFFVFNFSILIRLNNETHQALCVWKRGEEEWEWEYNAGDEFVQRTLYTCMELPQ